jgi:hypothetical protein
MARAPKYGALSYADAYDTRAPLRRGWGRGEAPYGQKVEPKMRCFLCTIAHVEKYSSAADDYDELAERAKLRSNGGVPPGGV